MSPGGLSDFFYFQHAWEHGEMRRWAQAAKQDEKNGSQLPFSTLGGSEGEGEAQRGEETAEDERCGDHGHQPRPPWRRRPFAPQTGRTAPCTSAVCISFAKLTNVSLVSLHVY